VNPDDRSCNSPNLFLHEARKFFFLLLLLSGDFFLLLLLLSLKMS